MKLLTAEFRKHIEYLRSKKFSDYLPKPISDITSELVELDDIVKYMVQSSSELRGRA